MFGMHACPLAFAGMGRCSETTRGLRVPGTSGPHGRGGKPAEWLSQSVSFEGTSLLLWACPALNVPGANRWGAWHRLQLQGRRWTSHLCSPYPLAPQGSYPISPFHRSGSWGSEARSHLFKATRVVRGKMERAVSSDLPNSRVRAVQPTHLPFLSSTRCRASVFSYVKWE